MKSCMISILFILTSKVFGCLAMASNPTRTTNKFSSQGIPCIFLGYPSSQKGYKLLNLYTQKIFVSRDVSFHEHIFPCKFFSTPDSLSDKSININTQFSADPTIPSLSTIPPSLPPLLRLLLPSLHLIYLKECLALLLDISTMLLRVILPPLLLPKLSVALSLKSPKIFLVSCLNLFTIKILLISKMLYKNLNGSWL